MPGAFNRQQLRFRWDHFHRLLEFWNQSEGIARAVDEQDLRAQIGQVLRALLLGLTRRMQRVRKQQQASGEFRLFGTEHARLASTIGMAAEEDAARDLFSKGGNSVLQAGAIARGVARTGRSPGADLSKREIAAEDGESRGRECLCHDDQQRCSSVAACSVGKNDAIAIRLAGNMQKPTDLGVNAVVGEVADSAGGQAIIVERPSAHRLSGLGSPALGTATLHSSGLRTFSTDVHRHDRPDVTD